MKKITEEINIVTSDEFVIFLDARASSNKCLPLFHGLPASIEDCRRLIKCLQTYIDRRELVEAAIELELTDTDELFTPMEEARARVKDLNEIQDGDFGYVYLAYNGKNGFFKIGKTINPFKRLTQLNRQFGKQITFWNVITCTSMTWAENYLHKRFEDRRVHNEWFALLTDEVNWILTIARLDRNAIEIDDESRLTKWKSMFYK